ncbi:MAG TPA: substrate-binding domain-containing protein [Usitatibacter sp.]|nr:substrate-binding domain-containing protein [Usitatibacter sp.]
MIRIDIRPVWRFRGETEREFDFQLVAILAELDASGKLTQAAEKAGMSYRHVWNLIAEWEEFFGAALVAKERGRGTTLTALGERLLWAGRRAQARLAPELDNLATEFARSLNESLSEVSSSLAVQASHDYAIGALRELAAQAEIEMDVEYKGSFDALAALRRGECDIAGFHVPEGALGELLRRRFAEGLPLDDYRLVSFATRTQGLVVRPGNPKRIGSIEDLARPGVRLANRQRGSGTRALLEFFISAHGLDRARIQGYESEEVTHGAVAALIAGQQADVGIGVQAAAAHYRLDFVPLCTERYYLACHASALDAPAMRRLIELLRGAEFARIVATLPGYSAEGAGRILEAFEPEPSPRP